MNELERLNKLREKLAEKLAEHGLELGTFMVDPLHQKINVMAEVKHEAFLSAEEKETKAYDTKFEDIIAGLGDLSDG